MVLVSGVFFPIDTLPQMVQWIATVLPLYHAISLVRPLMTGGEVSLVLLHVLVLLVFSITAGSLAAYRVKKRLIK